MPNIQKPYGFTPRRFGGSSAGNQATRKYYIPSTDTNPYHIGDVVKTTAGGSLGGTPAVTLCAGGDVPRGVIVGIFPVDVSKGQSNFQGATLNLAQVSIPAAKTQAYTVMVADDPSQEFMIQGDSTAFTASALNNNATYTVVAPSNATNPWSNTVLTGPAATATLPLKIIGIDQDPANSIGAYANFIVRFNRHELLGGTAGV